MLRLNNPHRVPPARLVSGFVASWLQPGHAKRAAQIGNTVAGSDNTVASWPPIL